MKFTVGMTLNLLLAAEMEVPVAWVADRPAAIAGQEREDRLSLLQRNNQVVMSERSGRALICAHEKSYTTTRPASQESAPRVNAKRTSVSKIERFYAKLLHLSKEADGEPAVLCAVMPLCSRSYLTNGTLPSFAGNAASGSPSWTPLLLKRRLLAVVSK